MIILVLGGKNNGKLDFVRALDRDDFNLIYKLNDIIFEQTKNDTFDISCFIDRNIRRKNVIIVCDEVGCGIVPIDNTEVQYRENVGRCCCEIAKIADCVIRVYSGIGTVIKGKL